MFHDDSHRQKKISQLMVKQILQAQQAHRTAKKYALHKSYKYERLWMSGFFLNQYIAKKLPFPSDFELKMPNSNQNYLELLRKGTSYNQGVVLVADLVNSVKMIEQNEQDSVAVWMNFFERVEKEILPDTAGRLIKSLGDGFIAEFETVHQAVKAAFVIQQQLTSYFVDNQHLLLRIGVDVGQYYRGEQDIYGHTVNIASRIASTAKGGEIFLSEAAKLELTADVDGTITDLGFYNLKNVSNPVRIYKINTQKTLITHSYQSDISFNPTIAFVPFHCLEAEDAMLISFSDILCEEFIRHFSPQTFFNIISRASSAAFRHFQESPMQIGSFLKAQYVVTGHYFKEGNGIKLKLILTDCIKNSPLLQKEYSVTFADLVGSEQHKLRLITNEVMSSISSEAISQTKGRDFNSIDNYQLFIAALVLMNRLDQRDFSLSQQILVALCEKLPHLSEPRAWLAQWYNLKIQQGWAQDNKGESLIAINLCQEVLNQNPDDSLALSVTGLLTTTLNHDCEQGRKLIEQGVLANPNAPLAWLFQCANRMFAGDGERAIVAGQRALTLSPYDNQKYMFDSLLSSAFLLQGNDHEALNFAKKSLQLNSLHASSHRVRIIALWRLGLNDEAKRVSKNLTKIDKGFKVNEWLKRSPLQHIPQGKEFSKILTQAGLTP